MLRERKKLEPRIPGQEIKSFSFFLSKSTTDLAGNDN